MSVNRHSPHVFVLPEDDANVQIADGFLLHGDVSLRRIQVLEEVGGWREVLSRFLEDHIAGMERYSGRFMILLIDFDKDEGRLQFAKAKIPEHLADRVFVLGALIDPETLKKAVRLSYDSIGQALAQDCRDHTNTMWGHPLLRHNATELDRLRERVRPILFSQG